MKNPIGQQLSGLRPECAQTNGRRVNGRAIFSLRISGADIYDLLKLLEGDAVRNAAASFLEVKKCVFLSEKIRNQARRQGF